MKDNARGLETISLGKAFADIANHATHWRIDKYANDKDFSEKNSFGTSEFDGNLLTNAGINALLTLLAGGGGTAYNNANSALAVGTGVTAAAATDTTLQTETARVAMDVSYPTYGSSQQIVFRATFTGLVANVHWQEFGVLNNITSGGTLLNHKISDQGTKTTGQTWQLTLTITIS